MRFVPPKSPEQLEIQAVHRIRQRVVASRTRLVKQARGLLCEHGIVVPCDIDRIRRTLSEIADGQSEGFGALFVDVLRDIREELIELDARLAGYHQRIKSLFRSNEMCQRIGQIEGIGPITATALAAAVGDKSCLKTGRQFAAWLGLVPKQHSSGGKARLFGTRKRGDSDVDPWARAALGQSAGKPDTRNQWIKRMRERRHPNVVAVASANKNARIV